MMKAMKQGLFFTVLLLGVSPGASAASVFTTRLDDPRAVYLTAQEFGLKAAPLAEITGGGDAHQNAAIIRAVLDGERSARRDVVVLNAAAALVAAGQADHIAQAVPLAAYAIDCGHARQRLQLLVEFTNRIA